MFSISRSFMVATSPPVYGISFESTFVNAGSFSWIVPEEVNSVSVVCVGGGGPGSWQSPSVNGPNRGGGGGALSYVNQISVTPGETLNIVVGARGLSSGTAGVAGTNGGFSSVARSNGTILCKANGGTRGSTVGGAGGTVAVGTGGAGGGGGTNSAYGFGTGGGGAGGYAGNGGKGGGGSTNASAPGNGVGGGGGGGCGYTTNAGTTGGAAGSSGGGVGIYGQGANGAGGINVINKYPPNVGQPGSGGSGVTYGAGGGGAYSSNTGGGAVRIIWPGNYRYFPTTRTATEY